MIIIVYTWAWFWAVGSLVGAMLGVIPYDWMTLFLWGIGATCFLPMGWDLSK